MTGAPQKSPPPPAGKGTPADRDVVERRATIITVPCRYVNRLVSCQAPPRLTAVQKFNRRIALAAARGLQLTPAP